ncbi:hypothetical protein [Saccharopolyspora sp. NPDC002376]
MQTWAKRGVQAALVTGGMLAVGSGVASADQACPERPTSPLGEPVNALGQLGADGRCLSDDLFPENAQVNVPLVESRAAHQVTALAGTLDPVRDLLPVVENDMTQEMPALRDWHTEPAPTEQSAAPLHLAGWIADPADARPLEHAGLPPFDGNRPVTPAEGFHRSLSWAGPIGEVIRGGAHALDEGTFRSGPVLDVPANLLTPHDDLVYFDGFGPADGIVDLWQGVLTPPRGGLLDAKQVDLTSAELPGFRNELHTVPGDVLSAALSAIAPQPTPRGEFVPLDVPGELQAKANELLDLSGLPPLLQLSKTPGTTERSDNPGVQAPLPLVGELNTLGGGQTSVPTISRITAALDAPTPRAIEFTDAPLQSDVAVQVIDELQAALPEHKLVTHSPLRPAPVPAPRSAGMALPVLGDSIPNITAMQDQTLPLPGLSQQVQQRSFENADTVVFSRI